MDITKPVLKPLFITAALIGCIVPLTNQAQATLVLKLQSGASSVIVVDNGVGDMDAHVGMIGFMGSVGNFTMNMVGGVGGAMAPWPTLMDLHGMNMSSTGGGTLVAILEDDGYVSPWPTARFLSSIGGTIGAGGSLASRSFIDLTGTPNTLGPVLADHGAFPSLSFSSDIASGPYIPSGPFGLAIEVSITHSGAALSSYDHEIRIAEPATLGLFGAALAGFGLLARRRRGM